MKKWLGKVFFTSDCARGALFSLTLLTLGNYLWLTFLYMAALALGRSYMVLRWVYAVGALLITFYALMLLLCALVRLMLLLWRRRTIRPLWRIFPAAALLAAGRSGFFWTFPPLYAVYFFCTEPSDEYSDTYLFFREWEYEVSEFSPLPVLYRCAVLLFVLALLAVGGRKLMAMIAPKSRVAAGAALALWSVLGLGYLVVFGQALYGGDEIIGPTSLPPPYWAAVFLLSLVLLLAGGLVLASLFAAAEEKKFRASFGRATLALAGLLALWYLVTLGLALYESRRAAAVREAVETRFGRPLTAAGLAALYRESGEIDEDFWKRQAECRQALPKVDVEYTVRYDGKTEPEAQDPASEDEEDIGVNDTFSTSIISFNLPDRPSAETLAWYGGVCRERLPLIEAWERCFDRVPPLPAHHFSAGAVFFEDYSRSYDCYQILWMERSRLILALSLGDIETAWACYRRMGNVTATARKMPYFLFWQGLERQRLSCMEKLLESRLLSDARLDELEADLAELERNIQRNHLQIMYFFAVEMQDVMMMLEAGLVKSDDGGLHQPPGALGPYRWIFPSLWYHAARDQRVLLKSLLQPDLSFVSRPPDNDVCVMRELQEGWHQFGKRLYALTARTRAMRALIRAERYRRAHGEFPKTLDDLPEDPLTGRAMIYEVGPAEIDEEVWDERITTNGYTKKTTADVVQIRSGSATLPEYIRDPEKGSDKTRARLRLGPIFPQTGP